MKRLQEEIQSPPRKMVVLTMEQDRYVSKYAKKHRISASEAVRRIIQKQADYEKEYKQLLRSLAE